jgi:hypothetical protein
LARPEQGIHDWVREHDPDPAPSPLLLVPHLRDLDGQLLGLQHVVLAELHGMERVRELLPDRRVPYFFAVPSFAAPSFEA